MNLFQLEYFVVLAETLSFTKASDKLHITQPTLSKLIVNLEHSIGSPLFIRNKRDVKLTPQGKIFYEHVKKTLDTYNKAIQSVKDVEKGTTGILNIGLIGTALLHRFPQIMNQFSTIYPTIRVNPLDYSYKDISKNLHNGDLDMVFLPELGLDINTDLIIEEVFSDMMCAVVHKEHKIAQYENVTLGQLKDEDFIHIDAKYSITDYNLINSIFKKEKIKPNTLYEANSIFNMLLMADCKMGVCIVAKHMQKFCNDSLVFIPIEGFETYFKIVCAYKDTENACIEKFLDVMRTHL